MSKFFRFLFSIILFFTYYSHSSAEIFNVRFGVHENFTRIVVDMDIVKDYHVFTLGNPPRLVIDFPEQDWSRSNILNKSRFPIIQNIRFGRFQAGLTRLVIDMNKHFNVENFFSIPANENTNTKARLVIDITPQEKTVPFSQQTPQWEAILEQQKSDTVQKRKNEIAKDGRDDQEKFIIVLDPGHGGVDPGAQGKGDILEKDITLDLAKKIQETVNSHAQFHAVLTRDEDFYIPLRERFKIAEELGAHLFVSLHADSIKNKNLRGASIYTLSEEASDVESDLLAKKENLSDIYSDKLVISSDQIVQSILLDLSQRNSMQEAAHFAKFLGEELKGKVRLLRNPRRFAGFAVLKSPIIPSILVEAGFLSNAEEAKLLTSKKFMTTFSRSFLRALLQYKSRLDKIK